MSEQKRFGLEDAIVIAVNAHRGQKDWAGWPYITHPLRIMQRMESEATKILGVLHDVIEDTEVRGPFLVAAGMNREAVDVLERLLTRKHNHPVHTPQGADEYREYILRLQSNSWARPVKIADLEDNISLLRMPRPVTEKDVARLALYYESWLLLKKRDDPTFTVKVEVG